MCVCGGPPPHILCDSCCAYVMSIGGAPPMHVCLCGASTQGVCGCILCAYVSLSYGVCDD